MIWHPSLMLPAPAPLPLAGHPVAAPVHLHAGAVGEEVLGFLARGHLGTRTTADRTPARGPTRVNELGASRPNRLRTKALALAPEKLG